MGFLEILLNVPPELIKLGVGELSQADDAGRLAVDFCVGVGFVAQPLVEPEAILVRLGGLPEVRLVVQAQTLERVMNFSPVASVE